MGLLDYKRFIIEEHKKISEVLQLILEDVELTEDDMKFLSRAEKVAGFNLLESDFKNIAHKKAIQYLFKKYFFPTFDLSKTLNSVDASSINSLANDLKKENAQGFLNLFKYKVGGVGPGEVMLYFLVNDLVIGGMSSAGADVISGGTTYEVKAVQVNREGYAYDFKMGGTFPDKVLPIIQELAELAEKNGIKKSKEINKTDVDELKKKDSEGWNKLEEKFRSTAYENYFKNHPMIFINNSKSNFGVIESIVTVQPQNIFLERFTSGTLKPMVKIR